MIIIALLLSNKFVPVLTHTKKIWEFMFFFFFYKNVHSSFIYDNSKLETQTSNNRRMNKQSWFSHTLEYYSEIHMKKIVDT